MKTELTDDQISALFIPAERQRRAAQKRIDSDSTTGFDHIGDAPARRVMVEKIIEGYLAIAPEPAVRWIPAVNRKPADGDFSTSGHVVILRSDNKCAACHSDKLVSEGADYYWMSINTLKSAPKEPINPEAVEESEFNNWWTHSAMSDYTLRAKEIAFTAWKAARKNKIP